MSCKKQSDGTMEQWNDYIGKQIKIIFEDSENHISIKEGVLIDANEQALFLKKFEDSRTIDGIPICNIIRFEVKE